MLTDKDALLKGIPSENTETFQRAIECGWIMPLNPPGWLEMLADATAYLAALKPEAPSHAG